MYMHFKKDISKAIILTLALFLIVFLSSFIINWQKSIYAWVEPTQTPPADNAPAVLHAGLTGQTKMGGLILNGAGDGGINALTVLNGYLQLGKITGGGPDPLGCTDGDIGRMIYDPNNFRLYICNGETSGRGWDYIIIPDN